MRREPEREAVLSLLEGADAAADEALFRRARAARAAQWGNRVFLYGFLYLSTFCRNDCTFCQYRRSNHAEIRYRKSLREVLEAGQRLAGDGVHLLDLTLGEDPCLMEGEGFARLEEMVAALRRATGLPVMVSPGVISAAQLARLRAAGADWYACYQETHDRTLFAALRVGQDFDRRCQARRDAAAAGLLVEDGLLTGVGENAAQLAHSLQSMYGEPLSQVRAMSYVPHACTLPPQAGDSLAARRAHELRALAAMRLLMPDRLVPASLDVDGLAGLTMRLQAGANVVTSLVPSGRGFAGVASRELDIDNERRGVAAVRTVLDRLGLEAASPGDYARWLTERRRTLTPDAGERTGGTCG
ncbi:methylornithine synthase PylB [uncultured Desulfovibrio sp.]|uniref:Methylornithine synthase PylB n=1 Tax=Candidatus Desulfovibrio intestinavium TaxID=2838534 RepID=A0A9D2KRX3_9BACT|nr:methylornithine synthase PylB [uncultured Desulfovibrio sp.]HJA80009.1 methylornithine synthase PylB [Candidatus Desulfovibrio intestinavium]